MLLTLRAVSADLFGIFHDLMITLSGRFEERPAGFYSLSPCSGDFLCGSLPYEVLRVLVWYYCNIFFQERTVGSKVDSDYGRNVLEESYCKPLLFRRLE